MFRRVAEATGTAGLVDSATEQVAAGRATRPILPTTAVSASATAQPVSASIALDRRELLHSLANRVLHSAAYQVLYAGMAVLSLVCLVASVAYNPAGWFYALECLIITGMVVEVALRFLAYGKKFWQSSWNVVDVVMVVFCVAAFLMLLVGECDAAKRREAMAEEILLIFRNIIQFSRLGVMMQKNRSRMMQSTRSIDLGSVSGLDARLMVPDVDASFSGIHFEDSEDYF
ncbi:hypothetical protein HK105_209013 [Polyrhizophydium stewartii]|uniref:Ion transport domain-containing protein n=1 Tax=Polyrhizophydium stewartii TaxID=2732419 RepID=A0ABR4MWD3_9FUNG